MPIRILLIEDNPDHAVLTQKILKGTDQNYQLVYTEDPKEGLRKIADEDYDLILCDYRLPDLSALDILRRLRDKGRDLPLVVVTSSGSEKIAVELMKEGAYDYVVKDSSYQDALPMVIKRAIDRYGAKKEKNRLEEELRKSNEELKKMYAIKSEFTSMVSHELRTPLAAIKESIAIVLDGSAGAINDEQEDFLDTAKRNVDRLARLINDVLDFQKLDSGRMEFDIQENDMNQVVKEIEKAMLPLAKEKQLSLIMKLDDKLPKARFDRDKIIQVLTNIVDNAVKFTQKGIITVTTNKEDNIIHVAVQDTGPGIKEEDMPRLFHRFEQLAGAEDRKTGGTGLGLAISKEIIEKHRGKIWAESTLSKGTTFHFTLPITERRG